MSTAKSGNRNHYISPRTTASAKYLLQVVLAMSMLALPACSSTMRMYKGQAQSDERIAILTEPYNSVKIVEVDGNQIPSWIQRVDLLPGAYLVHTSFQRQLVRGNMICTIYSHSAAPVLLRLEAGHRYSLYAQICSANDKQPMRADQLSDKWYWDLPAGEGIGTWAPVAFDLESNETAKASELNFPLVDIRGPQTKQERQQVRTEIDAGNRLMKKREYDQAIVHYVRSLNVTNKMNVGDVSESADLDTWLRTAAGLWFLKHKAESDKCLARAFEMAPQDAKPWVMKSYMLMFSYGHYGEALNCLDKAISCSDTNGDLDDFRAEILRKMGRTDEASRTSGPTTR